MMFDRLTALVVDDQELMRAVTANQLRSMGWGKVLTAKNGAEALRTLRGQRVDVLVADWNMPVMSGLELLRAVRGDPKLALMPVLMVTSETARSRIQDVIAAGVNGLLVKPYNAALLRTRLERMLATDPSELAAHVAKAAAAAGKDADALNPDSPSALPPTRILLVDPNAQSMATLSALFKDDYDLSTASSGAAALQACRAKTLPDLLLSDTAMPDMDGFAMVRRLRETHATANIPVIFITADTSDAARLQGMELGAVDFVPKTMPDKELRQRVRNFLRFVELRKQLQSDYDHMLENARLREEVENMTRHDLKGSLSGIVGMVQTLSADEAMPERYTAQLKLVQESAQQALSSVNLAGDMFAIETGRYQLAAKPVPVGEVLRRIVELARVAHADKELSVVVDTDVFVGKEVPQAEGEEGLCYSLFHNLVKNACEAAPRKSKVVVTLKDETPLCIQIQNKGVVPHDIRDTFFDKFVTSGKHSGSGLGTYSARMLTMAQNGTISMSTNDADNLTTLTVWLPRHVPAPPEAGVPDNLYAP